MQTEFNPHRLMPHGVAPWGLSYGSGMHACIGQDLASGVAFDGDESGSMDAHLFGLVPQAVQAIFDHGARPDPSDPPELDESTTRPYFGRYPIVFGAAATHGMIDVHAHVVLEGVLGCAGVYGPTLTEGADGIARFRAGDYVLEGVKYRDSPFMDVDRRLALNDHLGIELQVLSPNPITYFHHIEPATAAEFCRWHNNELALVVDAYPDRLRGFAQLPMQDVDAACIELRRAVDDLGLLGAYIGTDFGMTFDSERLDPLWAAAVELKRADLHPPCAGRNRRPVARRAHPQVRPRSVAGVSVRGDPGCRLHRSTAGCSTVIQASTCASPTAAGRPRSWSVAWSTRAGRGRGPGRTRSTSVPASGACGSISTSTTSTRSTWWRARSGSTGWSLARTSPAGTPPTTRPRSPTAPSTTTTPVDSCGSA